jgi:thiamine kinase-like enzyme
MTQGQRAVIESEIAMCVEAIRSWRSPWGSRRICSAIGTEIRSTRVPFHKMGPFDNELEMNEHLRYPACRYQTSQEEFERNLSTAKQMDNLTHRIVFSHGDLQSHNVLVHDGHVSGILDWEAAAWMPEYWDVRTLMMMPWKEPEMCQLMTETYGDQYKDELECERALRKITIDSYLYIV